VYTWWKERRRGRGYDKRISWATKHEGANTSSPPPPDDSDATGYLYIYHYITVTYVYNQELFSLLSLSKNPRIGFFDKSLLYAYMYYVNCDLSRITFLLSRITNHFAVVIDLVDLSYSY